MLLFARLFGVGLVSILATAAGCADVVEFRDCAPAELDSGDCALCTASCKETLADAGADMDAEASATATTCAGPCVPLSLPEWSEAVLLWFGPASAAPTCPSWAPVVAPDYHADLIVAPPVTCSACACDPPAGSCALPAKITAMNQPFCSGSSTPFDAPDGWTGACTSDNTVSSGALCYGVPCVGSLSIPPLVLAESDCMPTVAPSSPAPPSGSASWTTTARVCVGKPSGTCASPSETCAPALPDFASGFLTCILRDGDRTCPAGWPDKHIFFDHIDDGRACAPCACSAPVGSSCAGSISVFTDGACSAPPFLTLPLDATGPSCVTLPPGAALGSKAAKPSTYAPGTCQPSGGEPVGSTAPAEPSTFCCRASSVAP